MVCLIKLLCSPCRFRRKQLLVILVVTLLFITFKAFYTNQQQKKTYKHSLSGSLDVQNTIGWNRHLGEHVLSKFNFTMFRRLTSVLSHRQPKQHGYVVALSYSGQQGAGIQALVSLQCWLASFNLPMLILEPVILNTAFISDPLRKQLHNPHKTFLRFSDMFDIQHFNTISESLGYPRVGTREDFFTGAPRNVIFIDMKLVPKNTSMNFRIPIVVWAAESEPEGEQYCYQFENINDQLKQLTKESFCVVRIIEATHSYINHYIFSDKEVQQVILGDWSPQHVTVIFSLWRTPWYVVNNNLDNPLKCKDVGRTSHKEQFLPSPRLLSDAKFYETHFLGSSNEVALMIRMAHMVGYVNHQHSPREWTVDDCLTQAYKVTKEKQMSGYPMVAMDVGKFGSAVLAKTLGKDFNDLTVKAKHLLSSLYDDKLTYEDWEQSFTRTTTNVTHRGYIAALQRTLASRARCLILVGGGTFQDLAMKDYLRNHPNEKDRCVKLVCFRNEKSLKFSG